jgi:hypothetical protein
MIVSGDNHRVGALTDDAPSPTVIFSSPSFCASRTEGPSPAL